MPLFPFRDGRRVEGPLGRVNCFRTNVFLYIQLGFKPTLSPSSSQANLRLFQAGKDRSYQAADIEVLLGLGHTRVDGVLSVRILQVYENLPISVHGNDVTIGDRFGTHECGHALDHLKACRLVHYAARQMPPSSGRQGQSIYCPGKTAIL